MNEMAPREPLEYDDESALGQFRAWLVGLGIADALAADIVERVTYFLADPGGRLDFLPAVGVKRAAAGSSITLEMIWPDAFPQALRPPSEAQVREQFQCAVAQPLMNHVAFELSFRPQAPADASEYACFFGPSLKGYQEFAGKFITMKRALDENPGLARALKDALNRLTEAPEKKKGPIADEVTELILRLRSA